MPKWNKMLEAFGRSLGTFVEPADFPHSEHILKKYGNAPEFKKGVERGDEMWEKAYNDAPDRLLKSGDERYVTMQGDRVNAFDNRINRDIDVMQNRDSDERLVKDAQDEWDKAFARRKQAVRDWYGKDYPQDMTEEGAEAFEKELWKIVDELKAKGVPAQDILNRIKGND